MKRKDVSDSFDVARALDGRLCLTRDGREVLIVWDFRSIGADKSFPLVGYIKNITGWQPFPSEWKADGRAWNHIPNHDCDIVAMSDKWFEGPEFTPVETVSFDGRIARVIFDEKIIGSVSGWRFFGVIDGFDGDPTGVHWSDRGQCSQNPPEGGDISSKFIKKFI